jgi:DNA-binding GntR family transcriptional regulator
VKARNPDAARHAMVQHLVRVLIELERRAGENPELFTPPTRTSPE